MKIITLDLTGCKGWDELHERIRKAFKFPDWYGKNWDAFWDLVSTECDADKVIVKGEKTLSTDLKEEIVIMRKILDRNIEYCKNTISIHSLMRL